MSCLSLQWLYLNDQKVVRQWITLSDLALKQGLKCPDLEKHVTADANGTWSVLPYHT